MDTTSQQDRLLDLLYGECSPEEEAELRRVLEVDEELAAQWHELQATHDQVVRHVPAPEEVPQSVSDAILEAAAANAPDGPRRRHGKPSDSKGFWSTTMASGTLKSAVSVAVMLIGSAVVITLLFSESLFYGGGAAQEEVSAVSVDGGYGAPSPGSHRPEMAEDTVAASEEAYAQAEDPEEVEAEAEPATQEAFDLADESLAMVDELAEEQRPAQPAPRRRARSAPAPRPAAPQQEEALAQDYGADLDSAFGTLGASAEDRPAGDSLSREDRRPQRAEIGGRAGARTPQPEPALLDSVDLEEQPEQQEQQEQQEQLEAEEEPDRSDQARELLTRARSAFDDGEFDEAQHLLDQLFDQDLADELTEDDRSQATTLRDELDSIDDDSQYQEPPPQLLHIDR